MFFETKVGKKGKSLIRFYFKSWWVLEESCEEEIRKLWEESSGSYFNRMSTLVNGLKVWAGKIQAKQRYEVKRLNRRLEELNGDKRLDGTLAELMEVKIHLNMEMNKEERYWEQRARVNWLRMGDKNTSL